MPVWRGEPIAARTTGPLRRLVAPTTMATITAAILAIRLATDLRKVRGALALRHCRDLTMTRRAPPSLAGTIERGEFPAAHKHKLWP
jgi:hypothetical protein